MESHTHPNAHCCKEHMIGKAGLGLKRAPRAIHGCHVHRGDFVTIAVVQVWCSERNLECSPRDHHLNVGNTTSFLLASAPCIASGEARLPLPEAACDLRHLRVNEVEGEAGGSISTPAVDKRGVTIEFCSLTTRQSRQASPEEALPGYDTVEIINAGGPPADAMQGSRT